MKVRSASPFEERYGFCRARRDGNVVNVAGTAPITQDGSPTPDSAYDQMMLCGTIALEAMASLGAGPEHVVRTRMFVTSADDSDAIGRAHGELFGTGTPVATMVVVAGLLDPTWKVEIEVEALLS